MFSVLKIRQKPIEQSSKITEKTKKTNSRHSGRADMRAKNYKVNLINLGGGS